MKKLLASLALLAATNAWAMDANEEAGPSPSEFPTDFLVYSVTWQPSFCEMEKLRKPQDKWAAGCENAPQAFLTHGIWPYSKSIEPKNNRHPQFCEALSKCTGKECTISDEQMQAVLKIPKLANMVTQRPEGMFRHEWSKHGSCSGQELHSYFADFVNLRTVVKYDPSKFNQMIGKDTPFAEIKSAFPENTSFRCYQEQGKQYLHEVFYLIDRQGNPYNGEKNLQIGVACNDKAPTHIPGGKPHEI
ncbi:ribonuclease T2 family protein [Pseudomonas sp. L7]|uniref:ribonuclease T2 family protein n=1 Tax=Pseudomonas sp. L7 TaxID=3388343 RepID=UPI0039851928